MNMGSSSRRGSAWSWLRPLLFLCLGFPISAAAQSPSIAQQLQDLETSLHATEQQVEDSRAQMQRMQQEIDRLRAQLAAKEAAPSPVPSSVQPTPPETADAVERLSEDVAMLRSSVAQEQQAKVGSASHLPVHVTGLVLFNSFVNRGVVDQIDLPTAALEQSPATSDVSTGASLRQTILGIDGTGPVLGGAQTSARVSMDFFGGVTGSASSGPAGTARLRTAAISAAWPRNILEASYDTPLISPLSPNSYATVAQPSLAWSGNLWNWMPQLSFTHLWIPSGAGATLLSSNRHMFSAQMGLLDTQTLNAAQTVTQRSTGAGEASGQPGYETRFAFRSGPDDRRLEIGIGAFYGRQVYTGNQRVDTWAGTADWRIPFGERSQLTGELYRGRGLGSLGGGAYRNVVQYEASGTTSTFVRGLDAEGGWLQWRYLFSSTLSGDASVGEDAADNDELRTALPAPGTNPVYFYSSNRTIVGNLIYRPWQSFLISPEYRRLQSRLILGDTTTADIYTLTFGYQF